MLLIKVWEDPRPAAPSRTAKSQRRSLLVNLTTKSQGTKNTPKLCFLVPSGLVVKFRSCS